MRRKLMNSDDFLHQLMFEVRLNDTFDEDPSKANKHCIKVAARILHWDLIPHDFTKANLTPVQQYTTEILNERSNSYARIKAQVD